MEAISYINNAAPTRANRRYRPRMSQDLRAQQTHAPEEAVAEASEQWQKDFAQLVDKMSAIGMRAMHERTGTSSTPPQRVIITGSKRYGSGSGSGNSAAEDFKPKSDVDNARITGHGLVLEMSTWKPLAIPIELFVTSINVDAMNIQLARGLYEMLAVEDGTTINLYNWPRDSAEWRISTANGIDVSDVKWNRKTYREVLHECLANANITTADFYAQLKPGYSYSIGFRHPDFHPFDADSATNNMKLWCIQSVDLSNGKRDYAAFAGLPEQRRLDVVQNVRTLFKKLSRAFQEYVDTGSINFGYILRPKDPNTTLPHVLLESALMRSIRQMHYARAISRRAALMNYDRTRYLVLRAFISQNSHSFIMLFPCYSDFYKQLEQIVRRLAIGVLTPNDSNDEFMLAATKVRDAMHNILSKRAYMSPEVVESFIRSTQFIDLLYNLWTTTQ